MIPLLSLYKLIMSCKRRTGERERGKGVKEGGEREGGKKGRN